MKKIILSLLLFIIFIPFIVNAETCDNKNVTIESIVLDNKSDTVEELDEATVKGRSINLNLSMSDVGDNIEYKITIKNDSDDDYDIDETSLGLSNDFINYTIETEDNSNIIKAKTSKNITLRIQYKNEIPEDQFENGSYSNNNTLTVNLSSDDKPTNTIIPEVINNPNTGTQEGIIVAIIIVILIISLFIALKKCKKIKIMILIIVAAIIIPMSINALCKFEFIIESSIIINEKIKCVSFEEDSWETISKNVKNGDTSCYHVGDTRTVNVGEFGDHTVRIANMSTPEVCSQEGFSQTACGFVVEFTDNITRHKFNTENSNAGGWEFSEMRTFVNNDIYNNLEEELRNVIIDTYVVSGHEKNATNNYITTDKLYLLATAELWQKVGTSDIGYDSADHLTRQFDYYASIPVTSTNYSGAKKGTGWWLRSAHKSSTNYVGNVPSDGATNYYYGHVGMNLGVSPAFKVG